MARTAELSLAALPVLLAPTSPLREDERVALLHALLIAHAPRLCGAVAPPLAQRCASALCGWTRAAQLDGPRIRRLIEGGVFEAFSVLARAALAELRVNPHSAVPSKVLVNALHGAGNVAAAPAGAAKSQFEAAGLVEVCVMTLRDAHALRPQVVAAAGRALGNACFGGAGAAARRSALRAGALERAAGALRAHLADRAAARWTAHALGNLCYEGAPNAAQAEAAALGASRLVAEGLRAHGGHAGTAGTLLDSLANLVFRNRHAWERAVEGSAGLLNVAASLLRQHRAGSLGAPPLIDDGAGGHAFFSSCLFAVVAFAEFETRAEAEEAVSLASAHPGWPELRPWLREAVLRLTKKS